MGTAYLPAYLDNASFHLERFVPRLEARELSWRDLQEMTTAYRQRGVCSLLLWGTPEQFHINMMQSAAAFLHFLQGCPDDQKVTSQAKPFFDALCGGFFDAAAAIGQESRSTWNEGTEYEEDFVYSYLLMQLLFLPRSEALCRTLLERLGELQTAVDAARVEICRSMLAKDGPAFNNALAAILESRRERVAAMIERGTLSEELASWLLPFASEGLALLRIAENLGIPTDDHYLSVPEHVRSRSPFRFDAESWRGLDYKPARK